MSARMTWEERQALVSGNRARRADLPAHLTVGAIRDSDKRNRHHAPRNTWDQGTWSTTSPYYHTMATIDSRWDK